MNGDLGNFTTGLMPSGLVQCSLAKVRSFDWDNDSGAVLWALLGLLSMTYVIQVLNKMLFGITAPLVGSRSFFEPAWLVGLRFSFNCQPMVKEGYERYNKSGKMFKIRRNDAEIVVLPKKYVDELRDMPEEVVNATKANVKNIVGKHTIGRVEPFLESDLHRRTLQQKLTPSLGNLVSSLKDELNFTLRQEIGECKDWTPVRVNDLIIRIVARLSARIFVGPDLCRNDEWLYISINFTKNLGWTRNLLRLIPAPLRGIASYFMPSCWRTFKNMRAAQRLLRPVIQLRRKEKRNNRDTEEPNDFLQWMINSAREDEGNINDLSLRQLMISLGAIHTTSMQVSHFIYDFCTYPQYKDEIRHEIIAILREDGGFKKTTLNKMIKLDSFLKESQRVNSPFYLSFQRLVLKSFTLKDGTYLPKGTHLAVAAKAIVHDPELIPGGGNPEEFDPFRYSKLRTDPENSSAINRQQFATTDSSTLHFGHGKYACPGRFFASNEIKLILSHILIMYDFQWAEGASRPPNLSFEEASYPDPSGKVVMIRRHIAERDIADLLGVAKSCI